MANKVLALVLIFVLFSCSKDPNPETIIEGRAIDFYSNQPITTGYVKIYEEGFQDPSNQQLNSVEFVVLDSILLDSNGLFYYRSNEIVNRGIYKIEISRDSMISVDTNIIQIGMNNQIVLKTKKFQDLEIRIEYSSNEYSLILLNINGKFIEAINGQAYNAGQVIPYGYYFFWTRKIDTTFSVSVIPDYPYEIEFDCRLKDVTYYHFEETIELEEKEKKTIVFSDKNAL